MKTTLLATVILFIFLGLFLWATAAIVGITFWQAVGSNVLFMASFHGLIHILNIITKEARR